MKVCMSHVGKSHSTHIKESCNTYDAVTLHIWMNHVTDMHESWDTYESVMYLRMDAIDCVLSQVHNNSYVWLDSFSWVTWLMYMCDVTHASPTAYWIVSFRRHIMIHKCDVTHLYAWHDSFICVSWLMHLRLLIASRSFAATWLIHMFDVTWLYVCYKLIHTCDMTHSYVWWHIHLRPLTRLLPFAGTWRFHMCHMTHAYL